MTKLLKEGALEVYQDKYNRAQVTRITLDRIESDIHEIKENALRNRLERLEGIDLECMEYLLVAHTAVIQELCSHNKGPQHDKFREDLQNRRITFENNFVEPVKTIHVDLKLNT